MAPPSQRIWTVVCLLLFLVSGLAVRLIFAIPDLDPGRFWDERVSIWNVHDLVAQGHVRPQNALYPTLSYLPHAGVIAAVEAIHRVTGNDSLSMFDPEDENGFTPQALLVARTVSVIAGTLTLAVVFLLGRRLASPLVGLVATAIVSASWSHLFVSVKFKPDVLAVLLALVAFWWILDAAERPGPGRYALAGIGVGLSASTKYLGVSMAVPLVVVALATAGRELRTWGRLALTGAATLATFVVLNPWLGLIVKDVSRIQADYQNKAEAAGATHWTMFREAARWVVQDHRPVIAVFVVLGLAGLAARAAGRLQGSGPGRVQALAVLAAVAGHTVLYALVTANFRDWNYLPVLPFTAFAAAWAMVGASEGALARLPSGARAPARSALWATVLALFLWFPLSLTYTACVPSTWERASRALGELDGAPALIVYGEGVRSEIERDPGPPRFVLLEVESLESVSRDDLARSDAVAFRSEALEEPEAEVYRSLMDSSGASTTRYEPRWFRARGPSLVVVRPPWRLKAPVYQREAAGAPASTVALDRPVRPGETISLAVRVRRPRGTAPLPGAVAIEGVGEAALYTLGHGRATWMVSPKVQARRRISRLALELRGPDPPSDLEEVKLYRWER